MSEIYEIQDGKLRLNFHPGQSRMWKSEKRFVFVLSGYQAGKTSSGPWWLHREIQRKGGGDYLAVSPTFPLLDKKMLPEFIKIFHSILKLGRWWSANKTYEIFDPKLGTGVNRFHEQMYARVMFCSAKNADSLESATAKAAWIDECGQGDFTVQAWDAIKRRITLHRGRVLGTTCYDDQTEIYTSGGWKLIGELTDIDKVYAPDENGVGKFETPYRRTWERYSGEMYHFVGGRIDLCVTPNHRILYKNHKDFHIKDAEHFSKLSHRSLCIPKIINPKIKDREFFTLPSVEMNHRWGEVTRRDEIEIPMQDWCAFLGWWLAEGSVRGSKGGEVINGQYRVSVAQFKKDKKKKLEADLKKLPFKWSYSDGVFSTSNKQLWSYLSAFGNSHTKYIPGEIKHSGKNNLLTLIDRMIDGDGTRSKSEFVYYTTSQRLADDFQEVCMLAGISTGVSVRENDPFPGRGGEPSSIYHIWERKRKSGIVTDWEIIDYDGYIGCVGTSTGLVLVRRNGEECISGNTIYNWGWLKQQIYDPWRSGMRDDIDVIQFKSTDNPMFPREEYERARQTMAPWKFNMFYNGEYDKPAGMIYDSFDFELHKCRRFEIPMTWTVFAGIDFGGVNMAMLLTAQDPDSKRFYHFHEYLAGNRSIAQHAEAFRDIIGLRPLRWIGGAAPEDQWRLEFNEAGIPVMPPPIKDVEVGIQRVYGFHKRNQIVAFDDLTIYLDQKGSYARKLDENNQPTEEIENKNEYHILDCERVLFADLWEKQGFLSAETLTNIAQATRSKWIPPSIGGLSVGDTRTQTRWGRGRKF